MKKIFNRLLLKLIFIPLVVSGFVFSFGVSAVGDDIDIKTVDFWKEGSAIVGFKQSFSLDQIKFSSSRVCFEFGSPEWPATSFNDVSDPKQSATGNIWVIENIDGKQQGYFWEYIKKSQSDSGNVCKTVDQPGPDFCPVKGQSYGFVLTGIVHPAKEANSYEGGEPRKERSNIKTAVWEGPTATCTSTIPTPTPASNFSCALAEDGVSKYCSNDAKGAYTNSTCADNKGVSACPTLLPGMQFTCKSGNQCVATTKGGIFPDLSSCSKQCSSGAQAGPPEITKIEPIQSIKGAEISVYGQNLGTNIVLFSLVTMASTSVSGTVYDSSKALTKFNVPSTLTIGEYQVFVNGVVGDKDYTKINAKSPTNLTIKEGGSDFPGSSDIGIPEGYKSFGELLSMIFVWSLRLLGITVFVMMFYAGVLWMTARGNTGQVSEAQKRMTNAVLGAILLLSAYLILYTINPNLVGGTFTLPGVGTTPTQTTP